MTPPQPAPATVVERYMAFARRHSDAVRRCYSKRIYTTLINGGLPAALISAFEGMAGDAAREAAYAMAVRSVRVSDDGTHASVYVSAITPRMFRFEVIYEDDDWYIDRVYIGDELVRGFEEQRPGGVPVGGKARAVRWAVRF